MFNPNETGGKLVINCGILAFFLWMLGLQIYELCCISDSKDMRKKILLCLSMVTLAIAIHTASMDFIATESSDMLLKISLSCLFLCHKYYHFMFSLCIHPFLKILDNSEFSTTHSMWNCFDYLLDCYIREEIMPALILSKYIYVFPLYSSYFYLQNKNIYIFTIF